MNQTKVNKHCCKREEKRDEVLALQLSGCRVSGKGACKNKSPSVPVREFTDCNDQLFIGTVLLTGGVFACDVNSRSKPLNGRRLQIAECLKRGQKAAGRREFCCVHTHLHYSLKLEDIVSTVVWIHLAQDWAQYVTDENTVMNNELSGYTAVPPRRTQMKFRCHVLVRRLPQWGTGRSASHVTRDKIISGVASTNSQCSRTCAMITFRRGVT
jgi:hypothetical protein